MAGNGRRMLIGAGAFAVGALVLVLVAGCELFEDEHDSPPVELSNFEVSAGVVWPEVSVDLHNGSEKTLQAVSWWATFLDGHNRTAYGLSRDSVANFIFQSDTIAPEETVRGTWIATWFDLAVRVDEHGICKVTFSDGTDWTAPTGTTEC